MNLLDSFKKNDRIKDRLKTIPFLCFIIFAAISAQANDTVKAFNASTRLVTVDGSITEIVYALGAKSYLVGVDTTSVYPKAVTKLPKVGYIRQLNAEGLLSLNPDMLITTDGAGPKIVIDQVKKAGLNVQVVRNEKTLQGTLNKIEKVGQLIGKNKEAKALITEVSRKVKAIQERVNTGVKNKQFKQPRVLFLLAASGHGGVMAAGLNSSGNDVINLLGAENASTGFSSYKLLTPEGVVSSKPDVIVIATAGNVDIDAIPQLKMAKKMVGDRIVLADSSLLLGFGPRLAEAAELLEKAFYPSVEY